MHNLLIMSGANAVYAQRRKKKAVDRELYRRYLIGEELEEIAEDLSMTPRQVKTRIDKERKRSEAEVKALMAIEGVHKSLAIQDYVILESQRAWERSKEAIKTKSSSIERTPVTKLKDGKDGISIEKQKAGTKEVDNIGDKGFLNLMLEAVRDQRTLLGLDQPTVKRVVLASGAGEEIDAQALERFDPGELRELYREAIS